MKHQIDNVLSYLKRSLYLLFLIVMSVVLYFIFVTNKAYEELNKSSTESSFSIFHAVMLYESEKIESYVLDSSYWNEAVAALTDDIDQEFVEDNYLGDFLQENFSINHVVIYNVDGSIRLNTNHGVIDTNTAKNFLTPEFTSLIQQILQTDYSSPSTVLRFISIDGRLHFVVGGVLTPGILNEQYTDHEAYGVVVMTRPFDTSLLSRWEDQFHLAEIKILKADEAVPVGSIFFAIKNPLGNITHNIVWMPQLQGQMFIDELLPTTVLIVLFLSILSIIFGIYVNRYIKMTLYSADELHRLAHYDAITHLPNRVLGMDRLEQAISASVRNKSLTSVLFIDLDEFKFVNDNYGHEMGDKLLIKVGRLLESCIRINVDTVSRLGGDEFIVILTSLKSEDIVIRVAEKIIKQLSQTIVIDEQPINISASIGVAITSSLGLSATELIKEADHAMYEAKKAGKNQYHISG